MRRKAIELVGAAITLILIIRLIMQRSLRVDTLSYEIGRTTGKIEAELELKRQQKTKG